MASFIGEYPCKIDIKGRIMLPAAFKKQMQQEAQDRFVVKKDLFEQCLVLYAMDEWERQNALLKEKLNPYNREHNKFLRGFHKGAAELTLDATNRLLVPRRLLDVAGIEKEATLSGQDAKIEIWSKELYDSYIENDSDFASLASEILGSE